MHAKPRQHIASTGRRPDGLLPESYKTPYYPALDGLRTIAVAMVFLVHYAPASVPYGWLGVQLFFVLSGFLITGILFDTQDDPGRLKNFYVRRALRIFPLYYGVLAAVLCVALLTHAQLSSSYLLWLVYLQNFFWLVTHGTGNDQIFTHGGKVIAAIGHLWSLAVEEQFYLVWPLLVFWVRDRRRLMALCCTLILLRLGLAAYWQTHLSAETLALGTTYRMLPTQCDGFLMGGFLALWLRGRPSVSIRRRSGGLAFAAALIYAGLLALLHHFPALIHHQDPFDYRSGFQSVAGLPLANLAATFLVLAVLERGTWIYHICNLAPMRSLGRVSYGLYFFHLTLFAIVGSTIRRFCDAHGVPGAAGIVRGLFATGLTIVLSYASFYLFERHFLLLKNRFTSARRTE